MREHNNLFHVLAIHIIFAIYLVTLGNAPQCFGAVALPYAIILLFSFTTIKRVSANPDEVLYSFLRNYPLAIYIVFAVYLGFLALDAFSSSAIVHLVVVGFGLINLGILYFICPIIAGPMLLKLSSKIRM